MTRPLAIDLFSGLGGWAIGLAAAGWDVIRFDLEDMCRLLGEPYPEHSSLVIQNVLTLHGSQFKNVGLIVSSSPCQEFSYRAMPWKRAKALGPPELGMELFHAQFRIQREASEAAGGHIPMVVENVRGAIPWVGRSRANAGSMHFWGDVPALMPRHEHVKVESFRFDGRGGSFQSAAVRDSQGRSLETCRAAIGNGARFTTREGFAPGERQRWFNDGPRSPDSLASSGSKSPARKAASARIAKIPFEISHWIGRCWLPEGVAP